MKNNDDDDCSINYQWCRYHHHHHLFCHWKVCFCYYVVTAISVIVAINTLILITSIFRIFIVFMNISKHLVSVFNTSSFHNFFASDNRSFHRRFHKLVHMIIIIECWRFRLHRFTCVYWLFTGLKQMHHCTSIWHSLVWHEQSEKTRILLQAFVYFPLGNSPSCRSWIQLVLLEYVLARLSAASAAAALFVFARIKSALLVVAVPGSASAHIVSAAGGHISIVFILCVICLHIAVSVHSFYLHLY